MNLHGSGIHFATYDGLGNVQALVSATNGGNTAIYEYDAFGAVVRETGVVAKQNPMRFNTQFRDDVSSFNKYLYRELRCDLGRWTSADPISEMGGNNLYSLVDNDPLNL